FYSFARAPDAKPQYPAIVDFIPPGADSGIIRFLGFDILPRRYGEPFYALYFQALRPLDRDYAITLYLADEHYQLRGATELPQATLVWYPTSRWQPGETIRVLADTFTWWSGELPEFSVGLGILNGTDVWDVGIRLQPRIRESRLTPRLLSNGTLLHLMRFCQGKRRPQPMPEYRDRLSEKVQHRVSARVGDWAELIGYRVETTEVSPGGTVRVVLYWRSLATHPPAHTVFVHLLDEQGILRGQQDNPPVFGTQPLPLWETGDMIRDPYAFQVAADAPAGHYAIEVGLYDPTTGTRLPVMGPDGASWGDHILIQDAVRVR
ncbi:MAG: hypothetical protein J7M34_14415, partial [Anaerolineae bacterium]|nr:hypothetical protein [Anaerolineae bacterium]